MRMLQAIAAEPGYWIDELMCHIPGRTGILFRRVWLSWRLAALGGSGV